MASQSSFPDPVVVGSLSTHKQTFILLHGRGSSGPKFGPALLSASIPTSSARDLSTTHFEPTSAPSTLPTLFPHARFVFPTAPRRRATIYRRRATNQWFDGWHADAAPADADAHAWLAADGLRETATYLHSLLRREAALLPAAIGIRGIVLGGFSQGGAAGLVAALLWEGSQQLGAVVGLCTYLPFARPMAAAAAVVDGRGDKDLRASRLGVLEPCHLDVNDEEAFDPFERGGENDAASGDHTMPTTSPCSRAAVCLREQLEMPASPNLLDLNIIAAPSIFLGHGTEDCKVPVRLSRDAADFLKAMGWRAEWHEYGDLGHWYSQAMLADLVCFLQSRGF